VLDSSSVQLYYIPSTAFEQYLIAGNYYYPDSTEADQGVVAVGAGNTVTDILTTVGAVTNATIYFSHDSGAATTTYTFLTSTTITHNYNVVVEKGVIFSAAAAQTFAINSKVSGIEPLTAGAGAVTSYLFDLQRSTFRWNAAASKLYIGAGAYVHNGSTHNQVVGWNTELEFELQSTGNNGLSSDYGADGWHYIYLDDAAIIARATSLMVGACFRNDLRNSGSSLRARTT
jgi:hypothetical protein